MASSRTGFPLVISAPSGAGKSTLTKRLTAEFPGLAFSVSCTTRAPRPGEVDGRDYHFLDRAEFETRRGQDYFAEWAEVHGNFYGTPRQAALDQMAQGLDIIFEIDVQGATQLRQSLEGACFVFILPPSLEVLSERLRGRGTEDEGTVQKRLDNAIGELKQADKFDYFIVNDDLDTAYEQLKSIYLAQGRMARLQPDLAQRILDGQKL